MNQMLCYILVGSGQNMNNLFTSYANLMGIILFIIFMRGAKSGLSLIINDIIIVMLMC